METIIVKTDSAAHAKFLASFLSTVSMVKQVFIEPEGDSSNLVREPSEEYNWINPSRPATDEEIEQMLDECEAQYAAGEGIPLEKARALTKQKIAEWKKKNRM